MTKEKLKLEISKLELEKLRLENKKLRHELEPLIPLSDSKTYTEWVKLNSISHIGPYKNGKEREVTYFYKGITYKTIINREQYNKLKIKLKKINKQILKGENNND